MIRGIGTDIVTISRIKKATENKKFCERFFTEKENIFFREKKHLPQTIAGVFCAKEAVSKALGTGFSGFSVKDIEIMHDAFGKPYVMLYNSAKKRFDDIGAANVLVSISHSELSAVAFAVIEGGLQNG